jgi:hypothetical protein
MIGLMLIAVGLMIISLAMTGDSEGGGAFILFPFVFTNVGGWGIFAILLLMFAFFITSSLLPWYLFSRKGHLSNFLPFKHESASRFRDPDTMEYIITTELPEGLRERVYIETGEEEIHLRSIEGDGFLRSYSLPRGFELEEIDYDYEGSYLVLKLRLIRISGM